MALVHNEKLESEHFQNALKFVCFLFQIDTLYDDQVNAIKAFLKGNNVFFCPITRYGKSIVFQAIPLLVDFLLDQAIGTSTVIILCPLVSLMLDQVNRLKELGISADAVFQGQDEAVLTDVEDGIFSLVYTSSFL
jgi:superfamily II DNA helicase RecQ